MQLNHSDSKNSAVCRSDTENFNYVMTQILATIQYVMLWV